jgi:hypothetical protein
MDGKRSFNIRYELLFLKLSLVLQVYCCMLLYFCTVPQKYDVGENDFLKSKAVPLHM